MNDQERTGYTAFKYHGHRMPLPLKISESQHQLHLNYYVRYCEYRGLKALPCDEAQYILYMAEVARSITKKTLRYRVSAIMAWHAEHGMPEFGTSVAFRQAYEAAAAATYGSRNLNKPLEPHELRKMVNGLGRKLRDIRDKAILLLMYAGMMHGDEVINLLIDDILWSEKGITIAVRSKLNERHVNIARLPGDSCCPVAALRAWLDAAEITEGAAFFAISCGDSLLGPLANRSITTMVRRRLTQFGHYKTFHCALSLRHGAILAAFDRGVDRATIRHQAGMKSTRTLAKWEEIARLLRRGQSIL